MAAYQLIATGSAAEQPREQPSPEDALKEATDKLYSKLGRIIGRLREDASDPELVTAIRSVFKTLNVINAHERDALPQSQRGSYQDLSLSRIYELASSEGSSADTEELLAANSAFAEENKILVETVQSLNFQLDELRRQSADEVLGRGELKTIPQAELIKALGKTSETLGKIQECMAFLLPKEANTAPDGTPVKPLDERLLEALAGGEDIDPAILRDIPQNTGLLGRFLRRAGFAYDYKDLTAVRHMVVNVLQVNRKLNETIQTLTPAQEQVDAIRHNLSLLEAYAGHDGRQTPQYLDAMDEIGRLRGQVARYAAHHGEINELDAAKVARAEQIDQELRERAERLQSFDEEIAQRQKRLLELQEQKDEIRAEAVAAEKKLQEERIANRAYITSLNETHKEQTEAAEKAHGEERDKLKAEIEKLTETHRFEMAQTCQRMRAIEGGLLAEKLEYEIEQLRTSNAAADRRADNEREQRLAMEARIPIWIEQEGALKQEIKFWRAAARPYAGWMMAAGTAAAAAGFAAGGQVSSMGDGAWWYWGLGIGVPTVAFGLMGKADNGTLKQAGEGMVLGAIVGLVMSVVLAIPSEAETKHQKALMAAELEKEKQALNSARAKIATDNQKLLAACKDVPCQLVTDEKGNTRVVVMSNEYAGKKVTYDFTEAGKPKITVVQEQLLIKPAAKAASAALK